MASSEAILRQWNLMQMLQKRGEGIPLKEIAEELGVADRTIQRDFRLLCKIGIPLIHTKDDYGKRFWKLPHDFLKSGPMVIGVTEAISLHLAQRLLNPFAGTSFSEGIESIFKKIHSSIPKKALEYFAELDEIFYVKRVGQTDYSEHSDTIAKLTNATRMEKSLIIAYQGLWRRDDYTTHVDPYGLVFHEGDLFVVGLSHKANGIRIFKIPRISSVEQTDTAFERPESFKLEEHFKASFGIVQSGSEPIEVEVKFIGAAAALVEEREWHESQKLTWLDGEATLFDDTPEKPSVLHAVFRLGNLVEFKKWLKGFGVEAEVLKPESLREELKAELLAAANLYEN